jgi:hypothetical protein
MKKQFQNSSAILRYGFCGIIAYLVTSGIALHAQDPERGFIVGGVGTGQGGEPQSGVIISINGSSIGATILKTCDLDQDGGAVLTELKKTALACVQLWDTNKNSSLSADEFSVGLKQLFPAPPTGAVRQVGFVGVNQGAVRSVQFSSDELPTPDKQLAKHILAGADSNKDSALTFEEISVFLSNCFSKWDQDGTGFLNAQELDMAFGQLAKPD